MARHLLKSHYFPKYDEHNADSIYNNHSNNKRNEEAKL